MKIPPEYSEFSFYSVYSRGSISHTLTGFLRAITVKIRDFSARYPGKRDGCLHPAAKCVKVGPDKNLREGAPL